MYPSEDRTCPICDTRFQGDTLFCSPECEKEVKYEEDELAEGWEEVANAENPCY
jgi:hypothetical protein